MKAHNNARLIPTLDSLCRWFTGPLSCFLCEPSVPSFPPNARPHFKQPLTRSLGKIGCGTFLRNTYLCCHAVNYPAQFTSDFKLIPVDNFCILLSCRTIRQHRNHQGQEMWGLPDWNLLDRNSLSDHRLDLPQDLLLPSEKILLQFRSPEITTGTPGKPVHHDRLRKWRDPADYYHIAHV